MEMRPTPHRWPVPLTVDIVCQNGAGWRMSDGCDQQGGYEPTRRTTRRLRTP
jgi:hypothetical protein